MITAQDIREKAFTKAAFGGYAMNEVDDFLDELADDLAASQKESNVLKAKMKVLVTKIEEYRGSEDAMHLALVSAQRIAKEIEDEAQAKADALLADAEAQAEKLVADAQAEADRVAGDVVALREKEEARYAAAKAAAADYITRAREMLANEQSYINALENEFEVAEIEAESEEAALSVEEEENVNDDDLRTFMDAVYAEEAPAGEAPAGEEYIEVEEEETLF